MYRRVLKPDLPPLEDDLLKREENKNHHHLALKKGRIIIIIGKRRENERGNKEYSLWIRVRDLERDTQRERARTWYMYVVYKPLFSRTFVFFRKREILCRFLMKRRSRCCSYFTAEKSVLLLDLWFLFYIDERALQNFFSLVYYYSYLYTWFTLRAW